MREFDTWTSDDEQWLQSLRREYRKLKAQEEKTAGIYRFAREKFGKDFLKGLDPETRKGMPAIEEGNPETRAMGKFVRRAEALKRAFQRPGGPDPDALELARERLVEAGKILDGFRDEEEMDS